jgi:hypothetical protein
MVIGVYVGAATVGGAAYWFMYDPTGPQMSFYQLSHHMQCYGSPEEFKGISCEIFQVRLRLISDPHLYSSNGSGSCSYETEEKMFFFFKHMLPIADIGRSVPAFATPYIFLKPRELPLQ